MVNEQGSLSLHFDSSLFDLAGCLWKNSTTCWWKCSFRGGNPVSACRDHTGSRIFITLDPHRVGMVRPLKPNHFGATTHHKSSHLQRMGCVESRGGGGGSSALVFAVVFDCEDHRDSLWLQVATHKQLILNQILQTHSERSQQMASDEYDVATTQAVRG